MLLQVLGKTPELKILDILLSHPYSKYTKIDLIECAVVDHKELNLALKKLIKYGLIKVAGIINEKVVYQINLENMAAIALNSFQNRLAWSEIEKEREERLSKYKPITDEENKLKREQGMKTFDEWQEQFKDEFIILDPDGFDRDDPYFSQRLYSEEDFRRRVFTCTCKWRD